MCRRFDERAESVFLINYRMVTNVSAQPLARMHNKVILKGTFPAPIPARLRKISICVWVVCRGGHSTLLEMKVKGTLRSGERTHVRSNVNLALTIH